MFRLRDTSTTKLYDASHWLLNFFESVIYRTTLLFERTFLGTVLILNGSYLIVMTRVSADSLCGPSLLSIDIKRVQVSGALHYRTFRESSLWMDRYQKIIREMMPLDKCSCGCNTSFSSSNLAANLNSRPSGSKRFPSPCKHRRDLSWDFARTHLTSFDPDNERSMHLVTIASAYYLD